MRSRLLLATLCLLAACASNGDGRPPGDAPAGMVWIPGGRFLMGSDGPLALLDEGPVHEVELGGFWMDETEVTNAEFARFVEATGYVTTAEQPVDVDELMSQLPPGTPPPPPEMLEPGSLVFHMPEEVSEHLSWWSWAPRASWRRPTGAESDAEPDPNAPVVHVSYYDALAYAEWAGKRLPTEAEWEYAARGGRSAQPYVWGDEKNPDGRFMANIWQGSFPTDDEGRDGFARVAPVKSFAPNDHGLYDMAGNVWEWVADWYLPEYYATDDARGPDPQGPPVSFDPDEPTVPKRVTRGGSFLCSDSYCIGYRPSARMKTSPDTSLAHTGFRCVKDAGGER